MTEIISLYADPNIALRAGGDVIYTYNNGIENASITFLRQLETMKESFQSAYLEYLKLTSLGVNNLTIESLPVRNRVLQGRFPFVLDNILHGFGFPTFKDTIDDDSRQILESMIKMIQKHEEVNPELYDIETEEDKKYNEILDSLIRQMTITDPSNNNIEIAFATLNQVGENGKKTIDNLINCSNYNVRIKTLRLINKLLYFTYKENKFHLAQSQISRNDEIKRDMIYQIIKLRKEDCELYKDFFKKGFSEELINYIKIHASKHYTEAEDIKELLSEARDNYLSIVRTRVIEQYNNGTLDPKKVNIKESITNAINNYYRNVSKTLKNNPLNIEELIEKYNTAYIEGSIDDTITLTDLMRFKYYFDNYKDDPNYGTILGDFIDIFGENKKSSIDDIIKNQLLKIVPILSLKKPNDYEKGSEIRNEIEVCVGVSQSITDKIIKLINDTKPTNPSIIEGIDIREEEFSDYEHIIPSYESSIQRFIRSDYLRGVDNFRDLLMIKSKIVSSIVKHTIGKRKDDSFETIKNILTNCGCGNYLDIMNSILDTPECLEELTRRFASGKSVFNMSRITQKCRGLKGLGDIIDNDSNVQIMLAVENVYNRDGTEEQIQPDLNHPDTIENYILFIPNRGSNEGTSIYLALEPYRGRLVLAPTHVYLGQKIEYKVNGRPRKGIIVNLHQSNQHTPLDDPMTRFIGVSSYPQRAQLREMFEEESSSINKNTNRIGGIH